MTEITTFREFLGRAIKAGLTNLSKAQINACANDLQSMLDDPSERLTTPEGALTVWLDRIGGWRNVEAYARTITVQHHGRA